jgi:hypothetical protein
MSGILPHVRWCPVSLKKACFELHALELLNFRTNPFSLHTLRLNRYAARVNLFSNLTHDKHSYYTCVKSSPELKQAMLSPLMTSAPELRICVVPLFFPSKITLHHS